MSTFEAEIEQINHIKKLMGEISVLKPEELVRERELGQVFSFKSGLPYFERTFTLIKGLADVKLDDIPEQMLMQIADILNQVNSAFVSIQEFSPQDVSDPAQERDSRILQITNLYHGLYLAITPILALAARDQTDTDALLQEGRETLEKLGTSRVEFEATREAITSEMQGALANAQQTVDSIREAAAEGGVTKYQKNFEDEAEDHKKQAGRWLKTLVTLVAAALVYAGFLLPIFYTPDPTLNISQAIQIAIAKLVVFGIIYYGIVLAGRNYRAHRHNYVTNRHRKIP